MFTNIIHWTQTLLDIITSSFNSIFLLLTLNITSCLCFDADLCMLLFIVLNVCPQPRDWRFHRWWEKLHNYHQYKGLQCIIPCLQEVKWNISGGQPLKNKWEQCLVTSRKRTIGRERRHQIMHTGLCKSQSGLLGEQNDDIVSTG